MNQTASRSAPILIVDDDDFTRGMVEDLLRDFGVTDVVSANNGIQALALLKRLEITPALIICDIHMPEMDGIEFLRHLADLRFAGGICMLSGVHTALLNPTQRLANAYRLNILSVIEKPIERHHVAELLTKLGEQQTCVHPPRENITLSPDEVREGIERGYITLFFQPKVNIQQRRVVGAECLARYRHPRHGLLGPTAFIPVSEENQLIDALTVVVLHQAAQQLSIWHRDDPQLILSVNISMLNLHQLDLPEIFTQIVGEAGIHPQNIILEVTESGFAEQLVVGLEILVRLRMKGFQLSLDDFGTGYSTMQNLSQFPFSELKLDRGFVSGASNDPKVLSILEACVGLGKSLQLNLVAEGIENQEELELVTRLGCHEMQGYFIEKPLPAHAFLSWKAKWENEN